eukprot:TRINITY_DN23735_c0_g1_i1.p1 TRINITY_DN23735_c0_g1~~TRINITY_DN23735_c0_g1_i1.p1  ORF type:complete len:401 (-),score=107.68 TRINITY_DN23735_c0_g1_i1:16-1143(-)
MADVATAAESHQEADERRFDGQPEEEGEEEISASELKARGNEAYQAQDIKSAVDFWNRALRRHVEAMQCPQKGSPSPWSPECRELELALYLNLAQGYLRLGEPARALRACQVVLSEQPAHVKACCRAAEALLALEKEEAAEKQLMFLLQADPEQVDAKRLLNRIRSARKKEADKQKQIAKRMCSGATGYSEGRKQELNVRDAAGNMSELGRMASADPVCLERGLGLADAAAEAARKREARREAGAAADGPRPEVIDLEAFRAKATARSKKYNAFVDRMRQKQDGAKRSVKLAWLRGGRDRDAFEAFEGPLRDELKALEAEAATAALAADGAGALEGELASEDEEDTIAGPACDERIQDTSAERSAGAEVAMDTMD